jgi:hypothetical protein
VHVLNPDFTIVDRIQESCVFIAQECESKILADWAKWVWGFCSPASRDSSDESTFVMFVAFFL